MKKRNKAILTGATLLTLGTVTGYAATNILGNLDAIKENYNITFNFAKSQKQKADELQRQLDNESGNKEQLQNEINNLKSEIENIKTNHATEITNKQAEITAKQNEIDAKQQEVNAKQETITNKNGKVIQKGKLKGWRFDVLPKPIPIYALYDEDELLGIGTPEELSEEHGVATSTLEFYLYQKSRPVQQTSFVGGLGISRNWRGIMTVSEVWKDVVGYEGLYKVSNKATLQRRADNTR